MNPQMARQRSRRARRLPRALTGALAGASVLVLGEALFAPAGPVEEAIPPPAVKPGRSKLPQPHFGGKRADRTAKARRKAERRLAKSRLTKQRHEALAMAEPLPVPQRMSGTRSRLIERVAGPAVLPVVDQDAAGVTPAAGPLPLPAFAADPPLPPMALGSVALLPDVAPTAEGAPDVAATAAATVSPADPAPTPALPIASLAQVPVEPARTIVPVEVLPDLPQAVHMAGPKVTPAPPPAAADKPARRRMLALATMPRPDFGTPGPASPPPPPARKPLPVPDFGKVAPNPAPAFAQPAKAPFAAGVATTAVPAVAFAGQGLDHDGGVGGTGAIFSGDDELILQIETGDGATSDTVIGYGTRAGTYLPLGALARFLEVGLAISDDGHYASGWVLDEKRTLVINLREGTLTLAGKSLPLARGDAAAFEGELYLKAERFAALFPLTLAVNPRAQTIAIRTLERFPYEQRFERERAREKLSGRGGGAGAAKWPREKTPWAALSFPLADVETRMVSDNALGPRTETDLRLAGDLAFMTARVFASTSSVYGLTAARIEMGRQDPDARLLGPLRATAFAFGDVSTATLPLGLRGTSGRGATLTNAALAQASVFDTLDLRGELPNGNEVELYRNNTLIGSTRTPVNGQYEFLQVPVDYGLNVFRLVFYGPQGQRREEVRRLSVGDGRLGKGELNYTVGVAQKDINLASVRLPNFLPGPDYGKWRASAQVLFGVSTELTASASAAWFETDAGKRALVSGGMRVGLGGLALKLDAGYETRATPATGSGEALEVGLGGKLLGFSFALTHAEYRGRFSDEVRAFTADSLKRASELTVAGTLDLGWLHRSLMLPLSGRFRRIAFDDGHIQTDGSLASSLPAFGAILSSRLEYSSSAIPGTNTFRGLTGSFDLATLARSRTRYHASLDFGLLPGARLNAASFDVDHAIDDNTTLRAGIQRTFAGGQTTAGLSGYRRFRNFTLAFSGNYTVPSRSYDVQLRLGFSFGRNPLTRRLFTARPGLAGQGAIAIRAYEDYNGNRAYDPGEPVLPKVAFGNGVQTGETDADGITFIGGLGDAAKASIRLDTDTLPDIALAAVTTGIEVVPRAGRIHVSDFAIVALSEIEGIARFAGPGQSKRGVSGLVLLLRDAGTGKQVARVRSEADGFFYFEQVRPGTYRIELDPGQAQSLHLLMEETHTIVIGSKSAVQHLEVTIATGL
ncbi:hypothetical protein [Novosphingobium sp.]|uniref:hypothetical protein n=1 Tax=Novosphingobium sp. TaxID=1874826 RepID=UPI0025FD57FE|nr:hypothetical protein [Novosphingobium sp.]